MAECTGGKKACLIGTIEPEQGVDASKGRLCIHPTFDASFPCYNVKQLFERALKRQNLLYVLILDDQQFPEAQILYRKVMKSWIDHI